MLPFHKAAAYFNLGKDLAQWRAWLATGGHAICVVGYRKDGRFIIRNSWDTGWGDKGFAYPSEGCINGAFFPERFAVTLRVR
jgi:hypothetical protein